MKEIPDLVRDKATCCGCGACQNICPKGAISLEYDTMGFLYPTIDAEKCVNCKMCISVCILK